MKRKIIGVTVGSPLPKPDLTQTDPTKGDYVKGKKEFIKQIDDDVKTIVDDYLEENPPRPQFTINGESFDENGNYTVNSIVDITITDCDDSGDTPGEPGDFVVASVSDGSSPLAVLF